VAPSACGACAVAVATTVTIAIAEIAVANRHAGQRRHRRRSMATPSMATSRECRALATSIAAELA
jgi:hypothetical protein